MSFHFSSLFTCCKVTNVIEAEKKVDVSPSNITLISQISPSPVNTETNHRNSNVTFKKQPSIIKDPSASPKKLKKTHSNPPVGTAIFGSNNLPMNELMEDEQDYIPKDLSILLEDVQVAPKGVISAQTNEALIEEQLKFNALGLIGKGRKEKDGVIIFGKANQSNQMDVDCYLIFPEDSSYHQSHLFIVYYNKEATNYVIKFNIDHQSVLGKNVYIKLLPNVEYPIKSKEVMDVKGLTFHIIPCSNGVLNIIDVQKNNKRYGYKPKKNMVVTIGRDDKCTISYPEVEGLAKVHIQLTFSSDNRWLLKTCSDNFGGSWDNRFVGFNSYSLVDGFELEVYKRRIRFDLNELVNEHK